MQVGGHKISALAVENAVAAHPAVVEIAVLGLPHKELGEQVIAPPPPPARAWMPTPGGLRAHTYEHMPPLTSLGRFHFN